MTAPTYPPVDLAVLDRGTLTALAAWHAEGVAATAAELARRKSVEDRVARGAAYRITQESGDDPRWTPQPWDGVRLCAGPNTGWQGLVIDRCDDGCEQVDGQPRWRLHSAVAGRQTCIPREHLRPVPTVRRADGAGRARCNYPCRCCMGDPRAHLNPTTDLAGREPATANH